MTPSDDITFRSLDELNAIFQWINEYEEDKGLPYSVLIGGWAVYFYNSYYGSVDIDIVTRGQTERSLKRHLVRTRDYNVEHIENMINSVYKEISDHNRITIDFMRHENKNILEGRKERLPFVMLEANTIEISFDGPYIRIPNRSMLLLLKIKAAWDRKFRLDHGRSLNVSWEEGKLTKDYSDIIALLDMGAGQSQLQIDFLGNEFHRQPILFTVLDDILTTEYGYKQVYTTNERRDSLIERFRKIIG